MLVNGEFKVSGTQNAALAQEIRIFGSVAAVVNGQAINIGAKRQASALLTYLALLDGQPIEDRDVIAKAVYGEADELNRSNLSKALGRLETVLGRKPVKKLGSGEITPDFAGIDVDILRLSRLAGRLPVLGEDERISLLQNAADVYSDTIGPAKVRTDVLRRLIADKRNSLRVPNKTQRE